MSPEARAADIEQSDREYIIQKQKRRKIGVITRYMGWNKRTKKRDLPVRVMVLKNEKGRDLVMLECVARKRPHIVGPFWAERKHVPLLAEDS